MTCIISWINEEEKNNKNIWIISDSYVIEKNASNSYNLLLDNYSKIFSLSIICHFPDKSGCLFNGQIYFFQKIGFAFAGNPLVGTNVFLTLSELLNKLYGIHEQQIPSLKSISNVAAILLKNNIKQLGSIRKNLALTEIIIAGYCFKCNQFEIFKLTPTLLKDEIIINIYDCSNEEIHILGLNEREVKEKISIIKETYKNKDIFWWRAPFKALLELINDNNYPSVGGSIQLGIAFKSDFNLFSNIVNISDADSNPKHTLAYKGIEIINSDFNQIDDCIVAFPGMDNIYRFE